METLSASLIIIVVFMVASLSLNNVFANSLKGDEALLQNRIKELKYFTEQGETLFPFYEEREYWEISGSKSKGVGVLKILNKRNGQEYQIDMELE